MLHVNIGAPATATAEAAATAATETTAASPYTRATSTAPMEAASVTGEAGVPAQRLGARSAASAADVAEGMVAAAATAFRHVTLSTTA